MIPLAGCIIKDGQGKILLLHRNNGKHVQWEIPGGKIDAGETAEVAAAREIKEELGIDVVIGPKIGQKQFKMGDKDYHYIWFAATVTDGEPKVAEPETFDGLKYFSAAQMRQMPDLSPNARNFLAANIEI